MTRKLNHRTGVAMAAAIAIFLTVFVTPVLAQSSGGGALTGLLQDWKTKAIRVTELIVIISLVFTIARGAVGDGSQQVLWGIGKRLGLLIALEMLNKLFIEPVKNVDSGTNSTTSSLEAPGMLADPTTLQLHGAGTALDPSAVAMHLPDITATALAISPL